MNHNFGHGFLRFAAAYPLLSLGKVCDTCSYLIHSKGGSGTVTTVSRAMRN